MFSSIQFACIWYTPLVQTAIHLVTTTAICGSDLHMYAGRTNVEPGKVLGHENQGVIEVRVVLKPGSTAETIEATVSR